MNLVGRVLIAASIVLVATGFHTYGNANRRASDLYLNTIVEQIESVRIRNNTNNTLETCYRNYTQRVNYIHNQTIRQIQKCYDSGQDAIKRYDRYLEKDLNSINNESRVLQDRLAACGKKNDTRGAFQCYVDTFERNLNNLQNITSRSNYDLNEAGEYDFTVSSASQSCIRSSLIGNKSNSTAASNQLEKCLNISTNIVPPRSGMRYHYKGIN